MRFLSSLLRRGSPFLNRSFSLADLDLNRGSVASIRDRFKLRLRRRFRSADSSPSSTRGAMPVSVAAAVEEGSPAKRFWIKSRKEAVFAEYTPFVVCLAAGGLDVETFKSYVAQDVHFLKAFAKAYEMAEECADDDDAKAAITELRNAILDELKMHSLVVQEWGIDPTKEIIPNSTTTKYIDFLIATASGKVDTEKGPGKIATPFERTKVAAYTIGAMTPCIRLYAHLGKELQMYLKQDANDHPYKKWIENYSSNSFEDTATQIEELLDKLSVSLTGEELELIGKLYHQAMKLEIEFFTAQPVVQHVVVPLIKLHNPEIQLILFSDFDLTCTALDSCSVLAEIAILTAAKADQSGSDRLITRSSSSDMKNSWDILSRHYTEEYEQCMESLLLSEEAEEFDYESLFKSLRLLSDFEKKANSRVVESGVLKGMNLDDIKRAGERMALQDGCKKFFQVLINLKEKMSVDLHILSYCWCADLIRSAFSSVGCLDDLIIHSNEFAYEEAVSTGEIVRKMESPLDKVEKFKSIISSNGSNHKNLSIYIGDSVGDLLCLLEADIGIVVGSSTSLRRVGKHFGVSFVPLFPGVINKQRQLDRQDSPIWKGTSGVLYTVSSWAEIQAFVTGHSNC
ncbi:bifunctional TH2 protein, mitochondrial-like [Typha angustifolia]|uniref:bifunctional TH2 protein, mitochondrial-like n=1 Tax=Typha angustifolia TaxID=59011 RepID=UPI003C2FAF8C